MYLFTKPIVISNHCYSRFDERVRFHSHEKKAIRKTIMKDLLMKNMVYKEPKQQNNTFRFLSKSGRIYVLLEKRDVILVKTVIQQNRNKKERFKKKFIESCWQATTFLI